MRVDNGLAAGWTAVPHAFIDDYMVKANGEYVKTYLYLLRVSEQGELTLAALAEQLEMTDKAVLRALKYWSREGLIRLQCDGEGHLEGVAFLPVQPKKAAEEEPLLPPSDEAAPGKDKAPEKEAAAPAAGKAEEAAPPSGEKPSEGNTALPKKKYSAVQVLRMKEKDESFSQLIFATEQYLKKTLSGTDTERLAYLYDSLKLPGDALEYLVECCVEDGHRDIRYIESIALRLHEEGKCTLEAFKEDLRRYASDYPRVRKAFGLTNRQLTDEEKKRVDGWMDRFGMPMEMILEACARTVRTISDPSFAYAEAILQRWKTAGISSLAQLQEKASEAEAEKPAARSTAGRKNAKNDFNFTQRGTDYDALLSEIGL
ncbi:MAG: DnaD domain protein [Lachnospiraceae bacterium]|nr:DnaD domain protein [Lachnospiraceae bacterium]